MVNNNNNNSNNNMYGLGGGNMSFQQPMQNGGLNMSFNNQQVPMQQQQVPMQQQMQQMRQQMQQQMQQGGMNAMGGLGGTNMNNPLNFDSNIKVVSLDTNVSDGYLYSGSKNLDPFTNANMK